MTETTKLNLSENLPCQSLRDVLLVKWWKDNGNGFNLNLYDRIRIIKGKGNELHNS